MIQLSFWARQHKNAARCLIAIVHVLLFTTAVYTGVTLQQLNITIPSLFPITAAGLLLLAVALYPSKKKYTSFNFNHYYKRKVCEGVVCLGTLICVCFLFNDNSRVASLNSYETLRGNLVTPTGTIKETTVNPGPISRKHLRREIKELIREIRKNKKSNTGKTLAIIGTIILGLGLTWLLLGLFCSLSCSGQGALAAVVLIGGVGVIAFLMYLLINKISRSNPQDAIIANPST